MKSEITAASQTLTLGDTDRSPEQEAARRHVLKRYDFGRLDADETLQVLDMLGLIPEQREG